MKKIKNTAVSLLAVLSCLLTFNLNAQVIFEAEDAFWSEGKVDMKHVGYTGDGFVDTEKVSIR